MLTRGHGDDTGGTEPGVVPCVSVNRWGVILDPHHLNHYLTRVKKVHV